MELRQQNGVWHGRRVMQWRIGLMVLVSLAILVIMIMFFGPKDFVFNLKRLETELPRRDQFPAARVTTPAGPQKRNPHRPGRARRAADEGALVTAEMNAGRALQRQVCRIIAPAGRLTLNSSNAENSRKKTAGTTLHGICCPDRFKSSAISKPIFPKAIRSVATTSNRLGGFIGKLDGLIGNQRSPQATDRCNCQKTLKPLTRSNSPRRPTACSATPSSRQLKASAQMPQLMQETRQTIGLRIVR